MQVMEVTSSENLPEKDSVKAIRQFKNDALLTRLQIVFTILGIIVFLYTIYRMIRSKS